MLKELALSRSKSHLRDRYTNLVQSTSITAMVAVCSVLSDDMDVLHNCVTHYNNELGEAVEYEMLDPPMFG